MTDTHRFHAENNFADRAIWVRDERHHFTRAKSGSNQIGTVLGRFVA